MKTEDDQVSTFVEPCNDVHATIMQALGFAPDEVELRVFFGEEELPPGCTVAEAGLQDGAWLHVHLKRREEVGNEIGDRSHCDSWSNFNLVCPALSFDSDGSVVAWKFFARNNAGGNHNLNRNRDLTVIGGGGGNLNHNRNHNHALTPSPTIPSLHPTLYFLGVKMQVYRAVPEAAPGTYKLMGSNTLPTKIGENIVEIQSEERIAVQAGDVIGMRQMHASAIPSMIAGHLPEIRWAPSNVECWPPGQAELCFSGGHQGRDYAVRAVVLYE